MPTAPASLVSPPLFTAADIRIVDRRWADSRPETSLMERAGAAAARSINEVAGRVSAQCRSTMRMSAAVNSGGETREAGVVGMGRQGDQVGAQRTS